MMFVFFKQKTAYELRISDWSSDVCSYDLGNAIRPIDVGEAGPLVKRGIEQRVAGENQIGEVAVDQVGRTRIGDQAVLEAAVGNMQPLGDRDGHVAAGADGRSRDERKSTRLNSSH